MQRIIFRYRKDTLPGEISHGDLRGIFLNAVEAAGLPSEEGRRTVVMGPPLPPGATSEAEQAAIELVEPRDPSEVCRLLNLQLPAGIRVERAWIARPRSTDENPATLDEAVYEITWRHAPATGTLLVDLQRFLASTKVPFTRVREKKTQELNARALVRDIALLAMRDGMVRLRMTISVGPQGSMRPEEVLQAIGYAPEPGEVSVHRVALHRTLWRRPSPFATPQWHRE